VRLEPQGLDHGGNAAVARSKAHPAELDPMRDAGDRDGAEPPTNAVRALEQCDRPVRSARLHLVPDERSSRSPADDGKVEAFHGVGDRHLGKILGGRQSTQS
ncbi:MAG TPA: hypothetical protein VK871_13370, partial [Candidatus Limnocylindrales bacterium]|nr:hypothetical protein [Candidatus Limnocylindrales bacterium]